MPCGVVHFGRIHLRRGSSLEVKYINSVSKIDPGAHVALSMGDSG